eukprot:SAG11_NODE_4776_length_1769_cov_3.073653_2_plen_150_part_00
MLSFVLLTALLGGCSVGSHCCSFVIPLWLLLLVGGLSSVAGSLQQPGLQGLYAQLVGRRPQGQFQAFFFVFNYLGRALGSFAVGAVAVHWGDCALWCLSSLTYSTLLFTLLPNYWRFHPVRSARTRVSAPPLLLSERRASPSTCRGMNG